jgi:hypothetical protein
VRGETSVTRVWIAGRLKMGSASYLSGLLAVISKNRSRKIRLHNRDECHRNILWFKILYHNRLRLQSL